MRGYLAAALTVTSVLLTVLTLASPCRSLESHLNHNNDYFSAYAQLEHQIMMLDDKPRMQAYHQAINANAELFKNKVVLDVGCGTGILSLWAAQAGARRVYAVEARFRQFLHLPLT